MRHVICFICVLQNSNKKTTTYIVRRKKAFQGLQRLWLFPVVIYACCKGLYVLMFSLLPSVHMTENGQAVMETYVDVCN